MNVSQTIGTTTRSELARGIKTIEIVTKSGEKFHVEETPDGDLKIYAVTQMSSKLQIMPNSTSSVILSQVNE